MQLALALLALVGCAFALPQFIEQHPTFSRSSSVDGNGQFDMNTLTSDGAAHHSSGSLVQARDGSIYLKQLGTLTYTSPEGKVVYLTYIADEDGYRAQGTDIHGAGQQ